MSTRVLPAERIFIAVKENPPLAIYRWYKGSLANEIGTELWVCDHHHNSRATAVSCANSERSRWLRSGKGRP